MFPSILLWAILTSPLTSLLVSGHILNNPTTNHLPQSELTISPSIPFHPYYLRDPLHIPPFFPQPPHPFQQRERATRKEEAGNVLYLPESPGSCSTSEVWRTAHSCSELLGVAPNCSELLGGARRCSELLGAARSCSELLRVARGLSTPNKVMVGTAH